MPPIGDHYDKFLQLVEQSLVERHQDRFSLAITQSMGAGTKLVYALSKDKWVVYILFTNECTSAITPTGLLISVINNACARADLAEADATPNYKIRKELHNGCLLLIKLFLYSHLEVCHGFPGVYVFVTVWYTCVVCLGILQALHMFFELTKEMNLEPTLRKRLWMRVLQDGGQSVVREIFNSKIQLVHSQDNFTNFEQQVTTFTRETPVSFGLGSFATNTAFRLCLLLMRSTF